MSCKTYWSIVFPIVVVVLAFGFANHVVAQTPTGTILGKVIDEEKTPVAEAKVSVIHEDTNVVWNVVTDGSGVFEVPLLSPGEYHVEVEREGFRKAIRSGIRLQVNQRAFVEIALQVGAQDEQIKVVADLPLLETQSAAIGTVVDNAKIVELPLNGRDFFQLTTLIPGAVPPAQGSQNSTQGGAVSIAGAREQSNNFLLDGVDNNDQAINQIVVPPSVDFIQEYNVLSNGYSAEFGRSAGGQFNYVTKSGTNNWHGSGWEFHRNEALDARNFFDDPDLDKPQFTRNQFGGTVGGPFKQDKLFVFAGYERLSVRKGFTRIATVPPLAWRNGDFSSMLTGQIDPGTGFDAGQLFDPDTGEPFEGNIIPQSRIDPAGASILDFYPAPDDPNAPGPSDATVSPEGTNSVHQFTIRIDHILNPDNRLFYRYSFWDEDRFNAFDPLVDPTNVPGFGSFTENQGQNLGIGWTKTIGADMINDFRFGYNRLAAGIFQENIGNDVSSQLGITGLPTDPVDVGRPGIIVGITDDLQEATNLPQERIDENFQFSNSLLWLKGNHSFKAGVDIRYFRVVSFLDVIARGQFIFAGLSGNPIADLLLGRPVVALRTDPAFNTDLNFRSTNFDLFFQDDWRLTDDLTLNLGLRYEYNQPPTESLDRLSIPDLDNPDGGFIPVGTQGIPRAGYDADTNNFAPRLGFAWRPLGSIDTVIRGGYGIYYDTVIVNYNILPRFNPPFFALQLFPEPESLTNAFSGGAAPITFAEDIEGDFHTPYYHQFSIGTQRELTPDMVIDVSYVGSRGRNLIRLLDANQGPEGGPPFANPNFGSVERAEPTAKSSYDALQLRLERRFVDGFSLLGSYTWSSSKDNGSALFGTNALAGGYPQNSNDPLADLGPSDFDTPHRLVVSTIWDLPFGDGKRWLNSGTAGTIFGNWTFTGIAAFQSGRPFTVYYGSTANFSGTSNGANGGLGFDRPNQVGNPEPADPGPNLWFDPNAFAPPDNMFGNVGRNTLRSDSFQSIDIGIYRNFNVGPEQILQLRFEVFNLLNTTNFLLPINDLTNANAGRVVEAADSRQIQLGVKFLF